MTQTALFQEGFTALKEGRYADAKRLFSENEKKAGTSTQSMGLLRDAESAMARGDVDQAATLYQKVLEQNPSLPEAYVGLTRVGLFTKQLDAAKVHATAATRLGPDIGPSWTMLGLVAEAEGKPAEAIELMKKGAALASTNFICQYNAGRLLASLERGAEALEYLKRAIHLEPGNRAAHEALGYALVQTKQLEKAAKSFETVRDLDPKRVDSYATLADVLFRMKDFKGTLAVLNQGLSRCGEHPALLEKAVATCMLQSDHAAAVAYVRRELKVAPQHEQAHLNLASLLLLTREFEQSEAASKALLERNPNQWEAWFNLGNLYEAVPQDNLALEAYTKACQYAPDGEWRPMTNLGVLYLAMKRSDDAASTLEKAGRMNPKAWQPLYNLALAQVQQGKVSEALATTDLVLTRFEGEPEASTEAKKLKSNLLEKRA